VDRGAGVGDRVCAGGGDGVGFGFGVGAGLGLGVGAGSGVGAGDVSVGGGGAIVVVGGGGLGVVSVSDAAGAAPGRTAIAARVPSASRAARTASANVVFVPPRPFTPIVLQPVWNTSVGQVRAVA
jgi:hypothetical protein